MAIPTFRYYTLDRSFKAVHRKKPLVHCITNYVTANDCANAVLACGGSPIMSDEPEEVEEITSICDSLVINIGTLNKRSIKAMKLAGKKATELEHPIVLDPVGAGASDLRTQTAVELLRECNISVVRGNMSEIRALDVALGGPSSDVYTGIKRSDYDEFDRALRTEYVDPYDDPYYDPFDDSPDGDSLNNARTSCGVDAVPKDVINDDNIEQSVEFARAFARKIDAIVVITGEKDVVSDPEYAYAISNGSEMATHITGAGCMLSSILGAYVAAYPKYKLDAALSAVAGHGICGQVAERRMVGGGGQMRRDGTGSFRTYFIDALSNLNAYVLEDRALISTFELYFKIREEN